MKTLADWDSDLEFMDDIVKDLEDSLKKTKKTVEIEEGFYNFSATFAKYYDQWQESKKVQINRCKMTASRFLLKSKIYKAIVSAECRLNPEFPRDKVVPAWLARTHVLEPRGFSLVKSAGGIMFAKPPIFKIFATYIGVDVKELMEYAQSIQGMGRVINRRVGSL